MAQQIDPNTAPPPIKHKALLNVDLGEAYGNFKCGPDDQLIPLIDHANVACGFHAGDPLISIDVLPSSRGTLTDLAKCRKP